MTSLPDHAVIGLVAEHGDIPSPDQCGKLGKVLWLRNASGRIVRTVEKDGLRTRVTLEKPLDVVQVRAERALRLEVRQTETGAPTRDIRTVGGKVRTEHEDTVVWIDEGLAEQLLEVLGTLAQQRYSRRSYRDHTHR